MAEVLSVQNRVFMPEGTAVTVKAEPAAGYQFVQWSDGAKAAERTIPLTSDSTLKAQFVKVCKVTLTATDGGSVSGATSDAGIHGRRSTDPESRTC